MSQQPTGLSGPGFTSPNLRPFPGMRRGAPGVGPRPSSGQEPPSDKVQSVASGALNPSEVPPSIEQDAGKEKVKKLRQMLVEVEAKIQAGTIDPLQAYVSVIQEIGPRDHPRVRLDIILKMADHFLKVGKLTEAARGYNAALQFAQELLPNRSEEVSHYLLKPIQVYLQQIGKEVALVANWKQHRECLAELREKYKSALLSQSVREIQRDISQGFAQLVKDIVESCMALLGPAPCKFCFMSLGSLSREEICPYSDIECCILFEEPSSYFQQLAKVLELYVINMGETSYKIGTIEEGGVVVQAGFSLDTGGMTPEQFQNTPQDMAHIQKVGGGDQIHNNALREAAFMFGEKELFSRYKQMLAEILTQEVPRYSKGQDPAQKEKILRRRKIALELLVDHFKNPEFNDQGIRILEKQLFNQSFSISLEALDAEQDPATILNAKRHLCRFIPMSIGAIALFEGLQESNTFDRIALMHERGVLSSFWADKLLKWMETAFRLRIETHLHYRHENEKLTLVADPRFPQDRMLSMRDRQNLSTWCNTILLPFRAYVHDWREQSENEPDLTCRVFLEAKPLLAPLIALGKGWLNEGSLERARVTLEEALGYIDAKVGQLVKAPDKDPDPQFEGRRHEVALLLGDVHRKRDDLETANRYYEQAAVLKDSLRPMADHFRGESEQVRQEQRELFNHTLQSAAIHTILKSRLSEFNGLLAQWVTLTPHLDRVEKRLLNLEQMTEGQLRGVIPVDKITLIERLKLGEEVPADLLNLRVLVLSQLSELLKTTPHLQLQEALLKGQEIVLTMKITPQNVDQLRLPGLLRMLLPFVWKSELEPASEPHVTCARDFLMSPLLVWFEELLQASKKASLQVTRTVFEFVFRSIPDELKIYLLDSIRRLGDGSVVQARALLDYPLKNGFHLGQLAYDFQWHQLLYHSDMGYPDRIANATDRLRSLLTPIKQSVKDARLKMALLNMIEGILPVLTTPQELFLLGEEKVASPSSKTDLLTKSLFKKKSVKSAPKAIPNQENFSKLITQIKAQIQHLQSVVTQYLGTGAVLPGLEQQFISYLTIIAQEYQKFLDFFTQKGDEEKAFLLQPQVRLAGWNTGKLIMHEEWGRALLQLASAKKESGQYGRHNVLKRGPFHFKVNPELPGIEYAVWSLNQLVTGQGSPPHDLLRLQQGNEHHVVLLSQTVLGATLLEVLTSTPEKLNLLDPEQYSQMILMALLTNPEDGKADNYIVKEVKDAKGQLVKIEIIGVDNDHAFVPPLKQKSALIPGQSKDKALVKMILYCFDQMLQPIASSARRRFLSLNGAELLKRWLTDLQAQNRRYQAQFGKDEIQEYFKRDPDFAVVIPIYLKKGLTGEMYSKILRMQEALSTNPTISHLELLLLIQPHLGRIYAEALTEYNTPLERFASVTKGEYQITRVSNVLMTMTKSKQMLISMTGVDPKFLDEIDALGYTPDQSLRELREIVMQTAGLDEITRDLVEGTGKIFDAVAVPELVERILDRMDFKELTDNQQRQILRRIENKGPFAKLPLRHCKALDDAQLKRLLKSSPDLSLLDLQNCVGVKDLGLIKTLCPGLVYLNLSGNLNLQALGQDQKKPWILPQLRRLILNDCVNLTTLNLSLEKIRVLSMNGCTALREVHIEGIEGVEKLFLSQAGLESEAIDKLIRPCKGLVELHVKEKFIKFGLLESWTLLFPQAILFASDIVFSIIPDEALLLRVLGRVKGITTAWGVGGMNKDFQKLLKGQCPLLKRVERFIPQKESDPGKPTKAERKELPADAFTYDPGKSLLDASLLDQAQCNPDLTSLNLKRFRDTLIKEDVMGLGDIFPNIRELNIQLCSKIRPPDALDFFENFPLLQYVYYDHGGDHEKWSRSLFQLLRGKEKKVLDPELDLSPLIYGRYKSLYSDALLIDVIRESPQLQSIKFTAGFPKREPVLRAEFLPLAFECPDYEILDLSHFGKFLSPHCLEMILKHCQNLKSLNLTNCSEVKVCCVPLIKKYAPHLKQLTLTGVQLNPDQYQQLGADSHLNALTVHDYTWYAEYEERSSPTCQDEHIVGFASSNPPVETCSLESITCKSIIALARHCMGLNTLQLGRNRLDKTEISLFRAKNAAVKDVAFWFLAFSREELNVLLPNIPQVHTLSLGKSIGTIDDAWLQAFVIHCPQLMTLNIQGSSSWQVAPFFRFVEQLSALKQIKFEDINLDASFLASLRGPNPSVDRFNFDSYDNKGLAREILERFLMNTPNINTVLIKKVSDMSKFSALLKMLSQYSQKLHTLRFEESKFAEDVFPTFPRLTTLSLVKCDFSAILLEKWLTLNPSIQKVFIEVAKYGSKEMQKMVDDMIVKFKTIQFELRVNE